MTGIGLALQPLRIAGRRIWITLAAGHTVCAGDVRHQKGWGPVKIRIALSIVLLALVGSATAQEGPALLNVAEVRQLVERGEPADHARLKAHFEALVEQYAAQVRRHNAMAKGFGGNPNRNLGTGMSGHCRRLAELNTESATAVRELVAYHDKLGAGSPATAPPDAGRFHAGAGAPEPTDEDLAALAAKAATPADHRALEEYFRTLAARYTSDANAHTSFAMVYRGSRVPQVGLEHERLARLAREATEEASEAADMHRQLVGVTR